MKEYYTYAYLREDGTPYYIGKGRGKRILQPHRVGTPPKERRIYLKQNLTEQEAFMHEVYMINVLGRKDNGTGILRNLTDGGDGISGWVHNDETKDKIRNNAIGRKASEETKHKLSEMRKGKPIHSEEHKIKISERMKGNTLGKGKKWTEKDREIHQKTHKGSKRSLEARKKMSEAAKGRVPWNKGKKSE